MMWEKVVRRITNFISNYVKEAKAEGVVVGVSGGIDSACVAKLCSIALGKERVLALIMPEKGVTPSEDVKDALNLCDDLGIERKIVEISPAVNTLCNLLSCKNGIPVANLKPRIRMICLYYYANLMNRLVAGTGNKSELLAGYFTKYGDGGVDFLPIGDLYKTEVYKLAEFLEIPESIRKKKPSARLWRGQTDEDEMGISYEVLDSILIAMEKLDLIDKEVGEKELEKIVELSGASLREVKSVVEMVKENAHKRRMPPIVNLRDLI